MTTSSAGSLTDGHSSALVALIALSLVLNFITFSIIVFIAVIKPCRQNRNTANVCYCLRTSPEDPSETIALDTAQTPLLNGAAGNRARDLPELPAGQESASSNGLPDPEASHYATCDDATRHTSPAQRNNCYSAVSPIQTGRQGFARAAGLYLVLDTIHPTGQLS